MSIVTIETFRVMTSHDVNYCMFTLFKTSKERFEFINSLTIPPAGRGGDARTDVRTDGHSEYPFDALEKTRSLRSLANYLVDEPIGLTRVITVCRSII